MKWDLFVALLALFGFAIAFHDLVTYFIHYTIDPTSIVPYWLNWNKQ